MKVDIRCCPHTMLSNSNDGLELLGSQTTDSNGRLVFTIPESLRLPVGLHRLSLVAASDEEHPVCLTLAVVPPNTPAVICSIDGSFAASISLMGKVRASQLPLLPPLSLPIELMDSCTLQFRELFHSQ